MFGDWTLHFTRDPDGQNWIEIYSGFSGRVIYRLYPNELTQAWAMVEWRNAAAARARALIAA